MTTSITDLNYGQQIVLCGYTKKGVTRGRGDAKQVYGDDTVNYTLEVIDYMTMIKDELKTLATADMQKVLDICGERGYQCWEGRGKKATERDLTMNDLVQGFATLVAKREKMLERANHNVNAPQQAVYDSLGKGVKQHIETGVTYISGIVTDCEVVKAAANGSIPKSKSSGKVVAERVIARILNLRSRSYRTLDLSKGSVTVL